MDFHPSRNPSNATGVGDLTWREHGYTKFSLSSEIQDQIQSWPHHLLFVTGLLLEFLESNGARSGSMGGGLMWRARGVVSLVGGHWWSGGIGLNGTEHKLHQWAIVDILDLLFTPLASGKRAKTVQQDWGSSGMCLKAAKLGVCSFQAENTRQWAGLQLNT
jgi:hypothetical protein